MKKHFLRLGSVLTAAALTASLISGCATGSPGDRDINDIIYEEGNGDYMPNDLDLSYTSVFEKDGVEKVIRDSIIGGERSSLFNDGWKFLKTDDFSADYSGVYDVSVEAFVDKVDDGSWQTVTLPHDFQIIQKGNMGSRGPLTKDMAGWYKKTFRLPEELKGKRVSLRFDGIYQDSEVFINGQKLPEYNKNNPDASPYSGTHYYGYKTFEVDLSDYLRFGDDKPNVVTVVARDKHSSSRWYTGGGINRSVWLTVSDKVHVDFMGTYVYYELNSKLNKADVTVETEVKNERSGEAEVTVRQTVYNCGEALDVKIKDENVKIEPGKTVKVKQNFKMSDIKLWGLSNDESSNLYTVKTEILSDGELLDSYLTEFGMRKIEWEVDTGVYLNGEHIKIQGVCQHENLGSLGSANNPAALERQIVILKEMGVNSIRTAHNICTPELISLCNRYGILVFEEAYDSWDDTKDGEYSLGGQGIFFDSYESDIKTMVRRDRSAPCVFIWSIGNEIISTVWGSMEASCPKVEKMIDFVYEEDHSGDRFVTLAQMQWSTDFSREISAYICDYVKSKYGDYGVMGQNYRDAYMQEVKDKYPDYRYLGTEQCSAMRTRGVYHDGPYVYAHEDLQLSSLDNCGTAYFLPAEDMYMYDENRDWYAGQYIWSGFDYIGESTPYYTKNSYFGIIDTAGLPKDVYYFYRSVWNPEEDTVHILPYWDHNDGDKTTVKVYSNADKVELIYTPLPGSGHEEIRQIKEINRLDTFKNKDVKYDEYWQSASEPSYNDTLSFDFELTYHPGTVTAVAYYNDGHKTHTTLSTPGDAVKMSLRADRKTVAADGMDMSFIEINALDENGNTVLLDTDRISVEVEGAAELLSIDTGNPVDYDSYQANTRRLFNGKAVIYIRSNGEEGEIKVKVSSVNMGSAEITLSAVKPEGETVSYDLDGFTAPDSSVDDSLPLGDTVYARKLEITLAEGQSNVLTEDSPATVFNYKLLPEDSKLSDGKLKFSVIGTESYIISDGLGIAVDEEAKTLTVTGLKTGTYRVYGTYTNGCRQPQLLSTYTVYNESAVSDDESLINSAFSFIAASKLDSASRNASYSINYNDGVITGLNRPDDSLIYKDVVFGSDISKELILTCLNTGSDDAVLEVYVDDELYGTIRIPKGEAKDYSKEKMFEHNFEMKGITGTHDITFLNPVSRPTLHVGGFRFTGSMSDPRSAYERIEAEEYDTYSAADHLPTIEDYTDSAKESGKVLKIQDNTAAYYKAVDFGEQGSKVIEILMKMFDDSGRIAVKIGDSAEQYIDWSAMDCYRSGEYVLYRAELDKVYSGVQEVMLMAYPGASIYIDWFKFVGGDSPLYERESVLDSDGWTSYSGEAELRFTKYLNAKFASDNKDNGVKLDVTELIKAYPSGTEFKAEALIKAVTGSNASLFFENQNGERTDIYEVTDGSIKSTGEGTVLSGSVSLNYSDGYRIYLCITGTSDNLKLYSVSLNKK